MTDAEMLEFIEAQERHLRNALSELGQIKAQLRKGYTVTVGPGADVAYVAETPAHKRGFTAK